MLEKLWFGFKFLLSAMLVAGPLTLFTLMPHALAQPFLLGIAAGLLFIAALPWVDFTSPNRALGLASFVFALGLGLLAWQDAFGTAASWPKSCGGRGSLICELRNLLWLIGGPVLAALPWAMLSLLLLWAGLRLVKRTGRPA